MFPLDLSYLRPSLGDANRLYYRYGSAYIRKVLALETDDLILFQPMGELSGGIAYDESAEENDGAYTGVTLGQPGFDGITNCPLFDGANDYNNIYSAGFNADFDGQEGTFSIWGRVSALSVWTDSAARAMFTLLVSGDHYLQVSKRPTDNNLLWLYRADSTNKSVSSLGYTEIDWFHIALTWSLGEDEVKAFYNGSQVGSTQSGLGTWAGNLGVTNCCVGAEITTPTSVWDGWLSMPIVWKKALTPTQIATLAVA